MGQMLTHMANRLGSVAAALVLLLSGCFESDRPLFIDTDAVTPFPPEFSFVEINSDNTFKLYDNKPRLGTMKLSGREYLEDDGTRLTFASLGNSGTTYLAQIISRSFMTDNLPFYLLVRRVGDTVAIFDFPGPGKVATPVGADIHNPNGSAPSFLFKNRDQLFAAARNFESKLIAPPDILYRIASTPAQIALLNAQIEAATPPSAASNQPAVPIPADDPGSDQPTLCDQEAAYPYDKLRFAAGVRDADIVPRLAVRDCEKAVADFPHTARFRYQLGRAKKAAQDNQSAIANYQAASDMGYAQATHSLAWLYMNGDGVPQDLKKAAALFRRSLASGVGDPDDLKMVEFDPTGFANPNLFQAIFDGTARPGDIAALNVYFASFAEMFNNTDDCRYLVAGSLYRNLSTGGQLRALGQVFGAFTSQSSSQQRSGNGNPMVSGLGTMLGMAMTAPLGRQDAQLLYDKHSCNSAVTRQFFRNLALIAARM